MKKLVALLVGIALLAGCATRGFPPTAAINNFDHVDKYVCRGAQPNQYGLEFLARLQHVTLVINLRNTGDTWVNEGQTCTNYGIKYLWIPLNGLHAPSKADVEKILTAIDVEIKAGGKVFVHCQYGADRTGTIIACYEIRRGMSNSDACNEADFYGMSKFEFGMRHFIHIFK